MPTFPESITPGNTFLVAWYSTAWGVSIPGVLPLFSCFAAQKSASMSGRLSHSIRKAVTAIKTDSGSPICTIPSTKEPS